MEKNFWKNNYFDFFMLNGLIYWMSLAKARVCFLKKKVYIMDDNKNFLEQLSFTKVILVWHKVKSDGHLMRIDFTIKGMPAYLLKINLHVWVIQCGSNSLFRSNLVR